MKPRTVSGTIPIVLLNTTGIQAIDRAPRCCERYVAPWNACCRIVALSLAQFRNWIKWIGGLNSSYGIVQADYVDASTVSLRYHYLTSGRVCYHIGIPKKRPSFRVWLRKRTA